MSLDSLYNDLSYYEGQVDYWQTSANQYQDQIDDCNAHLTDLREQLAIANNTLNEVNRLPPQNTNVIDTFKSLGNVAEGCTRNDCQSVVKFTDPNEGHIQEAVDATTSLISSLQGEIDSYTTKLNTATEGKEYSDGRVSHYERCADNTREAIANYDEDDD